MDPLVVGVWDRETGIHRGCGDESLVPPNTLRLIRLSADGSTLAVACAINNLIYWYDLKEEVPRPRVWKPAQTGGDINSLDFRPDGRRIAAGYGEGFVAFWDLVLNEELAPTPKCESSIEEVRYSPGGDRLLTRTREMEALLWDTEEEPPVRLGSLASDEKVASAGFSHGGHFAFTLGEEGSLRFWNARDGTECLMNAGGCKEAAPLGMESAFVALTKDGNLEILTIEDPTSPRRLGTQADVECIRGSRDGRHVVAYGEGDKLYVFDALKGRLEYGLQMPKAVEEAHFTADGSGLLVLSEDGMLREWPVDDLRGFAENHKPRYFTPEEKALYGIESTEEPPPQEGSLAEPSGDRGDPKADSQASKEHSGKPIPLGLEGKDDYLVKRSVALF